MSEADSVSGVAAQAIISSQVAVAITSPGDPSADAPPVVFDRLSVERRVLGAITDELHSDRLGARNSLPAIADFLITDPNTTHPPPPNPRLDIDGLTLGEQVQLVLNHLDALIDAGLVARDGDVADPAHTYHLTDAGRMELQT
jgi:hypothetical protein